MKLKNKLINLALVLGALVSSGIAAFNCFDTESSKAVIISPGGTTGCNSSMNFTTYIISGPSTIDVSSGSSEEEKISKIRGKFKLSERIYTCLSNGNMSSTSNVLSSDLLDITKGTGETYTVSFYSESKTVTLNVILDTYAPVMSGKISYTINYDDELNINTLKSNITAIDEVDGVIEPVLVENNCSEKRLGACTVVFGATDKTGNESKLTVNVIRVDLTKPVINGPETVIRVLSSDLTIEELLQLYTVTDNAEIGLGVTLVSNEYTENKNKPGSYNVVVKATDSSGNSVEKTTIVKVIDDIKPTITGKNQWEKAYNATLTIDSMLSQLTIEDNYYTLTTNNLTIVSDGYTGNVNKPGTYNIVIRATDGSGNDSDNFTITVTVSDEIPPVFWANGEFYVVVSPTTLLSEENIAYVATELGMFDKTRTVSIELLQNDYAGNESVEGEYKVYLKGTYANGETTSGVVTFAVSDKLGSIVIEGKKEIEKKSGWNKFVDGFKSFFSFKWLTDFGNNVKDFIKNIGTKIGDSFKWVWNKLF